MREVNEVVATFLACVADEEIRNKINEDYVFKINSLNNIQFYLRSTSFKSKKVTSDNFEQCLNFALRKLKDINFRNYLEQQKICYTVFYDREKQTIDNIFLNPIINKYPELIALKENIINYTVQNSNLNIEIFPYKIIKEKILQNKDDLIQLFAETGQLVDSVTVSFIYNNEPLGELGEAFLDIGFALNVRK